jgi:hypothetical protein
MYATIRRYEAIDKSRTTELAKKVGETLVPRLSKLPGFGGDHQQGGSRADDAGVARKRADDARQRARAARQAAEQATTEYARRAHARVADVHSALALSHDDHARALGHAGDTEGT